MKLPSSSTCSCGIHQVQAQSMLSRARVLAPFRPNDFPTPIIVIFPKLQLFEGKIIPT